MKIKGVKPLKTIPKIETSDDVIDISSLSPSDVDKAIFEFAKLVRNDLK